MVSIESLNALLRKRKRPANVRLQAILELFARFRQERLLGAVLHAVDCEFGFQPGEAFVCFDVGERFLDGRFGGVRGKGFEHGVGRGGAYC